MRYWVGVTDNQWFEFLSRLGPDEVNFWHPSSKPPFSNLESGAPFLFKLKSPFNHIAGGAYFVKFSTLPLSIVWDAFTIKNGAASRTAFETMIRRLSENPRAKDPNVGCSVLTEPFFFQKGEWIPAPEDWAKNNVRGRYYDADGPHDIGNGLLLRADFHKLFDVGLVTITPELRVEVSQRIREEWYNGAAYYRLHGQRLANIPGDVAQQPAATFLSWHNENRFER
ncbi:MAG: HNH endonuclease [Deltaproteobacteria bacterium]|nr:HNH endonuclease [Deltaproteobacteria bacterium]